MTFYQFNKVVAGDCLEKVKEQFDKAYINKTLKNGETSLYFACQNTTDDCVDIVRFLLEKEWDKDATSTDQWKQNPIHTAAYRGNVSAVTALIEAGCDLDCHDGYGLTPINVASLYGGDNMVNKAECVRLLNSAMESRKKVNLTVTNVPQNDLPNPNVSSIRDNVASDLELLKNNSLLFISETGKTLLDKLLSNKNTTIIEAIKSKPVDNNDITEWMSLELNKISRESYRMIHECLLYRCIRHNYQDGFATLCTPDIVNRDSIFMGRTALETAVEYERTLCIKIMLPKLTRVDESWTRAVSMAAEKGIKNIQSCIKGRMSVLSSGQKKGFSRLQTAVFDNDPGMVEYIVDNKIVDPNLGDKNICSVLSVAYSMDRIECAHSLLKTSVVDDILRYVASVGDKKLFQTIINNAMPANTSVGETEPLLISLIKERNTDFCKIILRSLNPVLFLEKKNSEMKLPLHVCIEEEYWDIIDQIIVDTTSVNDEDVNGDTPLSLLFEKISNTDDDDTIDRLMTYIKTLIRISADIGKVNKDNKTVISFCKNSDLKEKIESFVLRLLSTQQTSINASPQHQVVSQ